MNTDLVAFLILLSGSLGVEISGLALIKLGQRSSFPNIVMVGKALCVIGPVVVIVGALGLFL